MNTLMDRIDKLPPSRRKKVEERARALIAEEMSLRDLRKARKQTQMLVAKKLGINQENVSRLEQRSDLLISTLSGYVRGDGREVESGGRISGPTAGGADGYCGTGRPFGAACRISYRLTGVSLPVCELPAFPDFDSLCQD